MTSPYIDMTEPRQAWEDGRRIELRDDTFEWWYFDFIFDGGTTAVVVFYTEQNAGQAQGAPTLRTMIRVTTPDGRIHDSRKDFPVEAYRASTEGCDVQMGPNWAEGDLTQLKLHAEGEGIAADLTLKQGAAAWTNPTTNDIDKGYYWFLAVPYGTVEGTLTLDGQTHEVRGNGYHDHNWGDRPLANMYAEKYWGRARAGDYSLVYACRYPADRDKDPSATFLLYHGADLLIDQAEPLTFRGGPEGLDLTWESGEAHVHATVTDPLAILDVTAATSAYSRFVAPIELDVHLPGHVGHATGNTIFEHFDYSPEDA